MLLLKESKKRWLLPLIVMTVIALILLLNDRNSVCKTIAWLILSVQMIIIIEFIAIVLFKWTRGCRVIAVLGFVLLTAYLFINKYIERWYIVIPTWFVLCVYMLLYLGGVKNCVIASLYKQCLEAKIQKAKCLYEQYLIGIEAFNDIDNSLSLTKIKAKREPSWEKYKMKLTASDMFEFYYAFWGLDTYNLDKQLERIQLYIDNLNDKNKAIQSVQELDKESDKLDNLNKLNSIMSGQNKDLSYQYNLLSIHKKNNIKKTKKILKRKI